MNTPKPIIDQPPPVANDRPAIADLVIADLAERKRIGIERYGVPLQPHNGRDALVDAYQEVLDLANYVRQEIEERKDLREEGALAEREKIVGFLMHHAGIAAADFDSAAEYVAELAQAIQEGEHRDTWPAPPPESEDACPCPTCVSCGCCASPKVDEDGLCVSCGGQPLAVSKQCRGFRAPHRHPDISDDDAARIDQILSKDGTATEAE